jgi:hypothetical protein
VAGRLTSTSFWSPERPIIAEGWVWNGFFIGESRFFDQAVGDVNAEAVDPSI